MDNTDTRTLYMNQLKVWNWNTDAFDRIILITNKALQMAGKKWYTV